MPLKPILSTLIIFFFFNDTATTEIYTLSLHDALPILGAIAGRTGPGVHLAVSVRRWMLKEPPSQRLRSPPRTGQIGRAHVELQSPDHLVCRLLLEKKKALK